MERMLLWSSIVGGLLAFLCRFLPSPVRSGEMPEMTAEGRPALLPLNPTLRTLALIAPFLGLIATLPTHGVFFAGGQRLGLGFLLGGVGALVAALPILRGRRDDAPAPVGLAAGLGVASAVVAMGLLFLRASLPDGLLGIGIGWFCSSFALLVALPAGARSNKTGQMIAAGSGMVAALSGAALLGVFHDPLTPVLAKETWSAILCAFASLGALFVAGSALLPVSLPPRTRTLVPWFVVTLAGGLFLHLTAGKIATEPRLVYAGLGGLLLAPIAAALLRRGENSSASGMATMPTLAVLLVASGFMAAHQALQGVGAAGFVLALWLSLAATSRAEEQGMTTRLAPNTLTLGLFATVLLLWRTFATRWAGDLRGVNLTDQYALFGVLLGATLPSLLATLPARWRNGTNGAGAVLPVLACGILCLAAPGAVILLFGAKSALALLIGLSLGAVYPLTMRTTLGQTAPSLLPALLAVAVALVLDQFTGRALDALGASGEMTRMDRLKWLAGVTAVVTVLVAGADRVLAGQSPSDTSEEV